MPRRVELEDARRPPVAEELVRLLVVERQVVEVGATPCARESPPSVASMTSSVMQAQEVDLEQAHLLDDVHVELRRDFVVVRPVERQVAR